jgi:hypothetical protein
MEILKKKFHVVAKRICTTRKRTKGLPLLEGILWLGANIKAWKTKIDSIPLTFGLIHSKLNHNLYFLV